MTGRKHVDVQIFGIQKSADTRKALRFFKERRVAVHFVDLKVRAALEGGAHPPHSEIGRWTSSWTGITKRFRVPRAFCSAHYTDKKWLDVPGGRTPPPRQMPLVRKPEPPQRGGGWKGSGRIGWIA